MPVSTWQPGGIIPPPPPFPPGDPRLGPVQAGYPTPSWMSGPSVQLSPYATPPTGRRRAPSVALVAGIAVLIVAMLVTVYKVLPQDGGRSASTPTVAAPPAVVVTKAAKPTQPTTPVVAVAKPTPMHGIDLGKAPSVAVAVPEIESYVEQARGHTFLRPVKVTPLADKAFLAQLHAADAGGDAAQEAAQIAGEGATYQALHLIPLHTDLAKLLDSQADEAVGGFYDPETKQLFVRAAKLTPFAQTVVAHELTHALDDQYFDLGKLQQRARNSDQAEAIRSLIEGDARSVEDRFRAALVPAERKRADAEENAEYGKPTPGEAQIPEFLSLYSAFPYELGEQFVNYLRAHGGKATLDAAFRDPPVSTLQVLAVKYTFLERHDPAKFTYTNQPPAGTHGALVDEDSLGTLGLASLLSEKAPDRALYEAAAGYWDGDRYLTTRSGSRICVRDTIRSYSLAGESKIYTALHTWAAGHPGASVTTTADPEAVLLLSCVG